MLACLSVTLCTKGATVRISRRAWLTGAGALAATMIAAACLAAPAAGGVQPPPRASIAELAAGAPPTPADALAADPGTASAALSADPAAAPAAALPALTGPMVALGDSY